MHTVICGKGQNEQTIVQIKITSVLLMREFQQTDRQTNEQKGFAMQSHSELWQKGKEEKQ